MTTVSTFVAIDLFLRAIEGASGELVAPREAAGAGQHLAECSPTVIDGFEREPVPDHGVVRACKGTPPESPLDEHVDVMGGGPGMDGIASRAHDPCRETAGLGLWCERDLAVLGPTQVREACLESTGHQPTRLSRPVFLA